jgi:Glycosyl transferase family 2
VKDGGDRLMECLASVRPRVDEVTILDTGSTDGTLERLETLAKEPGAPVRVAHADWRDDYAWARNESFAMAESDYLAWFDDDETLEGAQELLAILDRRPDVVYVRRVNVDHHDTHVRVRHAWHARVVRRGLGTRWVRPLHEYLNIDPDRDGYLCDVAPPTVRVVHRPVPTPGRHAHAQREHLQRHPRPLPLNLRFIRAMELMDEDRDWVAAAGELTAVLASDGIDVRTRMFALRRLATCLRNLGDCLGTHEAEREALRLQSELFLHPVWGVCIRHDMAAPVDRDPVWDEYDTEGPRVDPSVRDLRPADLVPA